MLGEELPCVQRRFHVNGEHDSYIRIGGTNNRVMDPSIFDAGLWISKAKREAILEEKRNKDTKGRDFQCALLGMIPQPASVRRHFKKRSIV